MIASLVAIAMFAGAPPLVPLRWASSDPASLSLLDGTPFNTVLVDARTLTPAFRRGGITVLGLVSAQDPPEAAARALAAGADGLVVEGRADAAALRKLAAGRIFVELRSREALACAPGRDPIIGTSQGVAPGIRFDESGVSAGPTSAPWIETNSGFVKYMRAQTDAAIWMANRAAPGGALRAAADAALAGAQWVAEKPEREEEWRRLCELVRFFAAQPRQRPAGKIGVKLDCRAAARPGNALDMFTSQHIPAVPAAGAVGITHTVSIANIEDQRRALLDPALRTHSATRLFNAACTLSSLAQTPGGALQLTLVNYTNHPIEEITIDLAGHFNHVTVAAPGQREHTLAPEHFEGTTRVTLDKLGTAAIIAAR